MLIVSYEFIAMAAGLFVVYYLIPKRFQWMLLLTVSYLFYSASGVGNLIYIISTTVSVYWLGRVLGGITREMTVYVSEHGLDKNQRKAYKKMMKRRQWRWLLAGLFFNFGILAVVKYTNFAIGSLNWVLHRMGSGRQAGMVDFLLPLGISYYTFQSMGYLIDVYRGKYEPEPSIGRLALFVSFFPQLIQGPISRFDDLKQTLFEAHSFVWRNVSFGLQRILWGYFKKLVIADRIVRVVTAIGQDADTFQGIYVLVGLLCYSLELYADFTGGIDITIGIAQVLGIRLQENFIRPFSSKSLAEYWRRWHITLMTWLKEYIFYPLSVCGPVRGLARFAKDHAGAGVGKRVPLYVSSVVVWFITGIWHGANWNFVWWGIANCVVLLLSQELAPFYRRFHKTVKIGNTRWYGLLQMVRTILLVSVLQMFEYYPNAGTVFAMLGNLLTSASLSQLWDGRMAMLGLSGGDFAIIAVGIAVMLGISLAGADGSVREKLAGTSAAVRAGAVYLLFLAVLVFGVYGIGYDASQFIYNQY